jgi:hypothetical protein
MRKGAIRNAVMALALFSSAYSADTHGIAGNRFFVGTLTFDDPSIADEAIVPNFSTLNHPVEGGNAVDNRFDWSFTRLLTPVLQVQVDSAWIHRNWPTPRTSGFDTTDVGIKSEIYRNNQHEFLVSAGMLWGIGHSGSQAVGGDEPNSIQPGVFFGKGFGDLPDAFCDSGSRNKCEDRTRCQYRSGVSGNVTSRRRAPPSDGDVLRLGRLNGPIGAQAHDHARWFSKKGPTPGGAA